MSASALSQYEILERIAEGAMGVVYKARDVRLDRLVALKFLSPALQASPEQIELFLQEARAISKLNHPNIATIYEADELGERPFLAFEYLPGGTLKQLIQRTYASGRLPMDQIAGYGLQIAEALAHTHRHGIVHRDVKSENALLTGDGRIKLTDFGVAQVMGREGRGERGGLTGTAAYMSPEQAQGLEVDHRSDIFSVGVILYEMASGRVPFPDPRQAVVLYDIINSEPPRIAEFRKDLPEAFQSLLGRLLEKDPERRLQTMEEAAESLRSLCARRRPRRPSRETARPAVAVLPFVDMSPDRDQEYFCDGVAEEIINALAGVKGLKVVSRTSSFQFKGAAYDIREIGRKLGVETVVEGSVRKAGDQLRATAQLIDVADGSHFWSQRYDRPVRDVFAVQDEIAHAIVEHLKRSLLGGRTARLVKARTRNLEAYNCYLEGRFYLNQRSPEALERALRCFERALERDPRFAQAHAGTAEASMLLGVGGYLEEPPREMMNKARQAAQKAIELDDACAEAHVALGLVYFRADWNWSEAEREFQKAIALNDGYASGHHQYALLLAALNRLDDAVAEVRRAHELDPLSLIISTGVGRILHWAGRLDEAVEQCKRTVELNPLFGGAHFDLSLAYAAQGRYTEAMEAIRTYEVLTGAAVRRKIVMAVIHAWMGERETARRELDELVSGSRAQRISPVILAIILASLGEQDAAMDRLERAYEKRDTLLTYIQCEPVFDRLRSHPRYPELIRKMGFPPVPAPAASGNPLPAAR